MYILKAKTHSEYSILAYVSGMLIFILFLAVLLYHLCSELVPLSKLLSKIKWRQDEEADLMSYQAVNDVNEELNATVTWIEAPT